MLSSILLSRPLPAHVSFLYSLTLDSLLPPLPLPSRLLFLGPPHPFRQSHHTACYLQESVVDVVDDLHVAGQQLLHQAHRPLLQGLWQHGVVGEGKDL